MKKLFIVLWFCVLVPVPAQAQLPADSLYCLQLEGIIENAFYHNNRPCLVTISSQDGSTDSLYVYRSRKKFRYYMLRDELYTVTISKAGYVPLQVVVNTRLNGADQNLYCFSFDAWLITTKRARTFNNELLHLPLAVVEFNEEKGHFAHVAEYTAVVKRDLVLQAGKRTEQGLGFAQ